MMPGPGHFTGLDDWGKNTSKGIGFGTSTRSGLNGSSQNQPGPGNYNL